MKASPQFQDDETSLQIHDAIQRHDAESLKSLLTRAKYDGHSSLQYSMHRRDGPQNPSIKCKRDANSEIVMFSPLKQVMREGDAASLQTLLDFGCESILNVTSPSQGFSALHYACQKGNLQCLRILLEHDGDPNLFFGKPFATPMHTLLGAWHESLSADKLSQKSYTERNYADCLRLLLWHKAESERVDNLGRDALFLACAKGLLPAVQILLAEARVKLKLRRGTYTALHAAVDSLSTDVVKVLFENASPSGTVRKSVLHLRDGNGNTPLHLVSRHSGGADDITRYLLQAGADPNIRNYQGDTPLLLAVRDWHDAKQGVATLLMDHGCDCSMSEPAVRKTTTIPREKILIEAILRHGPAIQNRHLIPRHELRETVNCAQNAIGWSPLHYAAFCGNDDLVKSLLDRGVDANVKDGRGRTPLFVTGLRIFANAHCAGGLDWVARLVQSNDPLPLEGEDLSVANNFDVARKRSGDKIVASLLIDNGATLVCLDADGNLPFSFACAVSDDDLTTIFVMVQAASQQGLFRSVRGGSTTWFPRQFESKESGCVIL